MYTYCRGHAHPPRGVQDTLNASLKSNQEIGSKESLPSRRHAQKFTFPLR